MTCKCYREFLDVAGFIFYINLDPDVLFKCSKCAQCYSYDLSNGNVGRIDINTIYRETRIIYASLP